MFNQLPCFGVYLNSSLFNRARASCGSKASYKEAPYVRRDGRRVPGTSLYDPLSDNYDRTRLQRLFEDTLVLAFAWHFHRKRRYAEHAAALVRTWLLTPETAMSPHL